MAWAMGAAVVISTLVPILINVISSGFHMRFEQKELSPKVSIINRI
jgi:hypothetical protein